MTIQEHTVLGQSEAQARLTSLAAGWVLDEKGTTLSRRFEFKGYAKAVYLSNLCVWLADQEGHHPDIAFGWGYCQISLTTHDNGGITENDFDWAAKLDKHLSVEQS